MNILTILFEAGYGGELMGEVEGMGELMGEVQGMKGLTGKVEGMKGLILEVEAYVVAKGPPVGVVWKF
ncbi:hypothetical protein AVEN_82594-1 [Araneus ventricosus]|uniref:Uncharacterized protein n=1 Tax=Araneus ventricosus TaxID=182803 RepID=A0A4Y2CPC3_ARAVE|nr:hypothetical protein AVEN_82594-1 [Araneus ventricosus]